MTNKFVSLWFVTKRFTILKRHENQFKLFLETSFYLADIVSTWQSSNYSQSARDYGDTGRNTIKCRRIRHAQKRVSGVRSEGHWVPLRGFWLEHGYSLPTWPRHSVFPFNFQRFWDKFNGWKHDSDWRTARQGDLSSSSNNSRVWNTNQSPSADDTLSLWNKTWENSRQFLQKSFWIFYIIVTVDA